ncbi:MAG: YIP1 family protein [Calditrichaceae bacterium]
MRSNSGAWESVTIPFFCSDCSQMELKATFSIDSIAASRKVYFEFQGIGGSAEIYINQKLIQFLPDAQILAKIPVNNELLLTTRSNDLLIKYKIAVNVDEGYPVFAHLFNEPRFLGLFEHPFIQLTPDYQIDQFKYSIEKIDQTSEVEYSFKLRVPENALDRRYPLSLDYSILSSDGRLYHRRIKTVREITTSLTGLLKIPESQLWDIENPSYISVVSEISRRNITLFRDTLRVALRTFRSSNQNFILNEKNLIIRGINYYQNYRNIIDENFLKIVVQDFKNIKMLGFNAVRFPGYFPNKDVVAIADTMGLLLFSELPVKRYPVSLFQSDNLLENTKTSIKFAGMFAGEHPSIVALGVGQEIPLYEGSVQKFYLIVNGFINSNTQIASYLSPIPSNTVYREKIADFYILDLYHPLQFIKNKNAYGRYALAGKAAIIHNPAVHEWDNEPSNVSRAIFLSQEIQTIFKDFKFKGGFIESYSDWFAAVPTNLTINQPEPDRMPDGIYRATKEAKPWLTTIDNIWDLANKDTIGEPRPQQKTNFFSILMVAASLVFLAIYRKKPRLRDNIKRAMRHPYGFFVDMRERRIIPLFNSFLVGAFSALILATYLGSFVYYYHNSFWMQEIWCLFLLPLDFYNNYLQYSSSPGYITLLFFIILFLYPLVVSIILYLINLVSTEKIRYRQGLAIALWSGLPLFFLLPVSIIGYHLLNYLDNHSILFILLGSFIIWSHFRIINGIRVLFITKAVKIFIILLLSYIIPLVIFWAVFRPESHWYDYFVLIVNAKSLF